MSIADKKIIKWITGSSGQYNLISGRIDSNLFLEAIHPDYRPIAKDIVEHFRRHKTPPDFNVLCELAADQERLAALTEIFEEEVTESEAVFYLAQIKDRLNKKLLQTIAQNIDSVDGYVDLNELNSNVFRTINKIDRLRKDSVFSEGPLSASTDERKDRYLYIQDNPNAIAGIRSGYPEIDEYTNGLKQSEMMTIVAPSSAGKSLLLQNMAANAWMGSNNLLKWEEGVFHDDGKNVVFVTLEMSKEQLEARVDAKIAKVKHKGLTRGKLSEEEYTRWQKALAFQKQYHKRFYILDLPRGSTALDIEMKLETIMTEFPIDLLAVDYLGIMSSIKGGDSDWLDVGAVSADLHELCRKLNIPLMTAAQRKTRPKQNKKDGKVEKQEHDIEDIGRSKMIGDNSNIVLLIEKRGSDENLREDMPIHIVKNRDGALGTVLLMKNFEYSSIESFPSDWASDSGDENAI